MSGGVGDLQERVEVLLDRRESELERERERERGKLEFLTQEGRKGESFSL